MNVLYFLLLLLLKGRRHNKNSMESLSSQTTRKTHNNFQNVLSQLYFGQKPKENKRVFFSFSFKHKYTHNEPKKNTHKI